MAALHTPTLGREQARVAQIETRWIAALMSAFERKHVPVGGSIRRAGRRLFAAGGVELMRAVLYRVAARRKRFEARRIIRLDQAWHGIGGWIA